MAHFENTLALSTGIIEPFLKPSSCALSNFSSFLDFHLGYNLTKNTTKVNSLETKIFNQKSFIDFDIYFNKLIFNFENDLYFFDKKSKINNY